MLLRLLLCLTVYLCMFTDAFAEASYSAVGGTFSSFASRKIESGSLEATALKDGWRLELLDAARQVDYLTDIEKDIILALNMVRTDPCRYAELYVKPIIASFHGKCRLVRDRVLRTDEGCLPAEELYEYLMHQVPVPLLVSSPNLHRSADELALDQSLTGSTGHLSSEGRSYAVRIRTYGRWLHGVAESIGYGGRTGFDMVNNMLIDDGVSDRGHRFIMMDPVFHLAGSSVRPHRHYGLMSVIDFAGSSAENIRASK